MDALETERLLIRPLVLDDLEQAHHLLDEDIQWGGPDVTLEQRRERLRLDIGLARWNGTQRLYGNRGLQLKSSGALVGICSFHPDVWSPEWKRFFWPALFPQCDPGELVYASLEMGIGYALGSDYRRQGYAAEAVQAVLGFGFDRLHLRRIFAVTECDNDKSAALMRRVGMHTVQNSDPDVVFPGIVGVIEAQK